MRLYDPDLMELMTFLTRRQAWLAPTEIAEDFRPAGRSVTVRTIHRWYSFLRETGGFVYYPYPRANVLGLQDVLVRVHGLSEPKILGILPFGSSFNVEVQMGTGVSHVTQGYWVPGEALDSFMEYWRAAKDLGCLTDVEVFRSKNTHFIFSPFQRVTTSSGQARLHGPVDNGYFRALLHRNIGAKFEVRLGEPIAASPLVIPLVVEHIWEHFSSRQVWRAIREKGEAYIRRHAGGRYSKALGRRGSGLRLLQHQWRALLQQFDEIFLQPRVFFDWTSLRNAMFVSLEIGADSEEALLDAAVKASERSIVTALKPSLNGEGRGHLSCFTPRDQLIPLLRIVEEFHHDAEPPLISIQDKDATLKLFEPRFCKLDWTLFDPSELEWQFHARHYIKQLKEFAASRVASDAKIT